jgi:acyl-CoA thioesterase
MAASVQETAEAVRDTMLSNDRLTRAFGMDVIKIAPGTATVQMRVRDDMLNGYDTCHGGVLASLADSAFAFACNSHGELSVASAFSIDFVAPARQGDLLTARSQEVSKTGRLGVYDTEVTNQRGERVAIFRGRSYTAKGRSAVAHK